MHSRVQNLMEELWPYFLLLALTILFFYPVTILGQVFYYNQDLMIQNYPHAYLFRKGLLSLNLPLYDFRSGLGYPLFAEGQTAFFNPLNIILYSLLPMKVAFSLVAPVTLFLTASLAYLYFSRFTASRSSPLIGAVSLAFSLFFINHVGHTNILLTAMWIPGIFLALDSLLLRSGNQGNTSIGCFKPTAALAILFALQFLSGHPQITLITIAGAYIYLITRSILDIFTPSIKTHFPKPLLLIRDVGLLAAAIILGIAAASLQVLPSLELLTRSGRLAGVSGVAGYYSLPPSQLLSYLHPMLFGVSTPFDPGTYIGKDSFAELSGYFGLVPTVLFLSSLFIIPLFLRTLSPAVPSKSPLVSQNPPEPDGSADSTLSSRALAFIVLAIISLFIMLGKYTPFWAISSWLDLGLFRSPARFAVLFIFAAVSLAVIQLDLILGGNPRPEKKRPALEGYARRVLSKTAVVTSLLLGLYLLFLIFSWILITSGRFEKITAGLIGERAALTEPAKTVKEREERIINKLSELKFRLNPLYPWAQRPLLIGVLMLLSLTLLRRSGGRDDSPSDIRRPIFDVRRVIPALLILTTFVDLYVLGSGLNPTEEKSKVFKEPSYFKLLSKERDKYRIFSTHNTWRFKKPDQDLLDLLPGNLNLLYDLDSANHYGALPLASYERLFTLKSLYGTPGAANAELHGQSTEGLGETPFFSFDLLDGLAVRYVITKTPISSPKAPDKEGREPEYRLIFNNGKTRAYESRSYRPKFFQRAIPEQLQEASKLADPGFDPRKDIPVTVSYGDVGSIGWTYSKENPSIIVTTLLDYPGILILIDGRSVEKLTNKNGLLYFRVPYGKHQIKITYDSPTFRRGLTISIFTLLFLAIILIL